MSGVLLMFQSPSNRVKCSDLGKLIASVFLLLGFNPLAIGSNVLMQESAPAVPGRMKFQSPSNRVKCSDRLRTRLLNPSRKSFNPLAIGSNVLIRWSAGLFSPVWCVSIP